MSHKDKKIERIAQLAADGENTIVYAVNLDFLSNEEIEGYEEKRILLFLGYRDETTCNECIKGSCTVPVKRVEYPDGRKMAVYRCPDPDHGGRFEIELDQLRYWKINTAKLIELGYIKKLEKTLKEIAKPLNVRVANAVIKHQNANSEDIAKMVDSTPGSVRTTPAWKMRKQLRQRYETKKGWKDSEGSMDAYSEEIQSEHWDIYQMFQDYKSGKNPDYPSIERIADKLEVKEARAKELLKQAQSMLGFEANKID